MKKLVKSLESKQDLNFNGKSEKKLSNRMNQNKVLQLDGGKKMSFDEKNVQNSI